MQTAFERRKFDRERERQIAELAIVVIISL